MGTLMMQILTKPLIVGKSKGLRVALESCRKAAAETDPVLIQGELGTGKLLLATYLHCESSRHEQPFMLMDCGDANGGITELLSQSTMAGPWEFLKGGTLYFNEVASLTLAQQVALYELCLMLQSLDIRVLLGSSQNIHLLMYDKAFDSKLYHLVSPWEVSLPPLRQRTEDLGLLVEYFIKNLNLRLRRSVQGLTPQVEEIFAAYRWPENIDELQHVLARAIIVSNDPFIGQRHLTEYLSQMGDESRQTPDIMPLDRMEEILLRTALNRYGYSLEGKKKAARALNISLATLYNKVKRYNLNVFS